MTQAKIKVSDNPVKSDVKSPIEQKEESNSERVNDKYVQVAAWVLLTLGLCIIASTFYLAINQRNTSEVSNNDNEKNIDRSDTNGNKNGENVSVNIVERLLDDKVYGLGKVNIKSCESKLCKMICMDTGNIYTVVYESMELSNCSFLDSLVIYNQKFFRGALWNNWYYAERTIKELAFVNSNITIIRSDAFNTQMFSTTFLLYWRNLNLQKVESGALLGLHSLKYLMIDTKINCLDRAFFQPVQTTLVYIKLRAGMTFPRNENIFGISLLEKLEYADLSQNNFNGPITGKTFQGTPNLRYLIMSKSKVTAISPDAFTHLIGKLIFLDLTHNMLTTLDYDVLGPLLKSNSRTFVNVAMNSWVCDCDIGPLAKVYKEYRSQFMDALYCKAPHSLYGKFIYEINLSPEECKPKSTTSPENVRSDELEGTTTWFPYVNVTDSESIDDNDNSIELRNVHLRCWTTDKDSESYSSDYSVSKSNELLSTDPLNLFDAKNMELPDMNIQGMIANIESFDFLRPEYDIELHLFDNDSVRITILELANQNLDVNVIWFDEEIDQLSQAETPCIYYTPPYIVTDALKNNKTYTFCIVYMNNTPISPFNCLPLYVPFEEETEENIWIPRDQKQFTIGMLCLIFILSIFTGAVIAYFGIKAYPDLLEGSKNVLVVKKSDQTCYVSTISEEEYIKKSSLKKKKSASTEHKVSIPSICTISQGSTSSIDLKRLASVKSSSTYFEDAFQPLGDEYEMPKPIGKPQPTYESHCIPNTYVATSPRRSPPPLPKRNSKCITENIY